MSIRKNMGRGWNFVVVAVVMVVITIFLLFPLPHGGTRSFGNTFFKYKRKALVLATKQTANVEWTADVPKDWDIIRYVVDNKSAQYSVSVNQGHEAMPYITYVLDHYDNLPDYVVFAHGHEKSWHQPEPMQYIVQSLNLPLLDHLGLVSLRCTLQNTCEGPKHYVRPIQSMKWDMSRILVYMHEYVFRPEDDWYEPLPLEFAFPCCGQFAVTRNQILKKPKEYWRRIHTILSSDFDIDFQDWNFGNPGLSTSWKLGGVFEFTWHWWFSMPSVLCLETDYCRNNVFQGKIHCDGTTWQWTSSPKWKNISCTLDS